MTTTTKTESTASSHAPSRGRGKFGNALSIFKAVIGWACIALLVIFVFSNWQTTEVNVLNASLTAPVGMVVVLSALLGGVGAQSFKTLLSWVMRTDDK